MNDILHQWFLKMPFKKLEVNRLTTDCTIKVQIIQRNKLQTQKFCIVWIKEQSNNKQSFSVCQACSWEQLWHDYRVETLDFKKYGGSAIIIGVANLSFNECMCSLSVSVYVQSFNECVCVYTNICKFHAYDESQCCKSQP